MPAPSGEIDLPQHLVGAFANAFSIGTWTCDLGEGVLDLLSPVLDFRNVPRRLYPCRADRSPSMKQLHGWLETCAPGDAFTVSFTFRDDPVAVRIFCTERQGDLIRGLVQDCTSGSLNEENDLRFRMALMGAAHGIALVGIDGEWLQMNEALCRMLGYTAEELRACTFQDITWPDDLEADLDALRREKEELESQAGAFLNRAKDAKDRLAGTACESKYGALQRSGKQLEAMLSALQAYHQWGADHQSFLGRV